MVMVIFGLCFKQTFSFLPYFFLSFHSSLPSPFFPLAPVGFGYSFQMKNLNSQDTMQDTQTILPTSTTNWEIFLQQVITTSELANLLMGQSVPAKSHIFLYILSNVVLLDSIRKGKLRARHSM